MDAEAELIGATVPAPALRAAMKSNPGLPVALWNAAKAEPQVALFGHSHQVVSSAVAIGAPARTGFISALVIFGHFHHLLSFDR